MKELLVYHNCYVFPHLFSIVRRRRFLGVTLKWSIRLGFDILLVTWLGLLLLERQLFLYVYIGGK